MPAKLKQDVTYQDYLRIDDQNRYEIIKGELIMVPAPDTNHQNISKNLEFLIWKHVKEKLLGNILYAPTDVILDAQNVVQPDILFISMERKEIIKKRGIFGSPDLVIEIISPSSRYYDTFDKKALYEKFGVKEYWIVDPKSESIEVLVLNTDGKYNLFSEGYLEEDENDMRIVKSKVIVGLEIELEEVFYSI